MTIPRVLLAPGASGSVAGMRANLDGLRARGLVAEAVALPKGKAERAVPAYRAAAGSGGQTVVGGHSYGGRVASLLVAEQPSFAGLVLLSYPLHPPGRTERWRERTDHWPRITCPVLLLSGDRDPFARIELLRQAVGQLPRHELVVYPGLRHGIGPRLEDALDRIAEFTRSLAQPVHSGE
jgi:predicted alpha/beta-hydrolase family hydrolase